MSDDSLGNWLVLKSWTGMGGCFRGGHCLVFFLSLLAALVLVLGVRGIPRGVFLGLVSDYLHGEDGKMYLESGGMEIHPRRCLRWWRSLGVNVNCSLSI